MIYSKLRHELKTGDVILFSGRGVVSAAIKLFTRSRYSHVGMVIRIEEWDIVLVMESTTLTDVADVDEGIPRRGVQIVPLSTRIHQYDGSVWIAPIKRRLNDEQIATLVRFRHEIQGKYYEQSMTELIKSAWDGPWGKNDADLSSIFCSELVAEAFQRIGLLPINPPANEYKPRDLGPRGMASHLIKGVTQVK